MHYFGIPIWLIGLVLLAALRNRKRVRSNPDEFEFKHKKGDGWQRGKSYARWVSDVLIVHSGIALIRSDAAQITAIEVLGQVEPPPKGLGGSATEVLLEYADGASISFAVSAENLAAMMGPYAGTADSA